MGNGDTTQATDRTRPWLLASVAAISWGTFTITVLHIISSRNPVLDTLSSYAFTDRGTGMLAASMLSLAIGSLATAGALMAAGIPVSRTTGALFGTWSGGLTVAAMFPASYPENPNPMSGQIHQYSCLVAFLSVPAIGVSLLDRLREVPALQRNRATVKRWTRYSAISLLLFGLSYLLAAFPGVPVVDQLSAILPVGFTQRVALAVDIVLIGALMLLAARAASVGHSGGELGAVPVQAGQPAGVHEHELFASAEFTALAPADERGGGLAGVDRIQHNTFRARENA
jgi:hypothetical protein